MKQKLENLLIRILFRLIGPGGIESDGEDKEVIRWLSSSSKDIGFIRYCEMRERELVKALLASGMLNNPRDSFVRQTGQRFELHTFLNKARIAGQKQDQRIKERNRKSEEARRDDDTTE